MASAPAPRRVPPQPGSAGAAKYRGEQRHGGGNERGLRQIRLAPAQGRNQKLHARRRRGAAKAVGRLQNRHRHAAAPHEITRQERHKYDEPEAVRAYCHDDPIEQDDLPKRRNERTAQQPKEQQPATEHEQAAWPQAIDQRAYQRRTAARDQLRNRIGDRGLGARPVKLFDERHEKDRIGMHDRGGGCERGKGAAEHQPSAARRGP